MAAMLVAVAAVLVAWVAVRALSWWRGRSVEVVPTIAIVPGAFARLAEHRLGTPDRVERDLGLEARPPLVASPSAESHAEAVGEAATGSGILWGAAVADGAVPVADVWLRWSSVDPHVFQAVEHMTHEQIDGFADLLRVVDAKGYAIETTGFFNKLLGHVGEWHVQEHLMNADVAVAMPAGSNEPGTDIWADGHPLNVKAWADASDAAHSHFADYPHIPIVVPADAADVPADALHFDPAHGLDTSVLAGSDHLTVVDDALSRAELDDHTDNAIDVLQDPGPHLHVPWITMAVSGFREGRLLLKGSTDLGRAAKNVVVDTAAVGGGGMVGMKAGAALGTVIGGPVGTVIGGIAGGLLGAIGGRAAANAVKRMPLEDAKAAYEKSVADYRETERVVAEEAGRAWDATRSAQQARYSADVARLRRELEAHVQRLRTQVALRVILDRSAAEEHLAAARAVVDRLVAEAEQALRDATPGLARAFPGGARPDLWARVRRLRKEAAAWRRSSEKLLRDWSPSPSSTAQLFDHVLAVPAGERAANDYLRSVAETRRRAYYGLHEIAQRCLAMLTLERRKAVDALRQGWERITSGAEARLAPAIETLRTRSEEYRVELRKAGVDA